MKYKVLAAEQDNQGIVNIPEGVTILNGLYHPVTGKFVVVCLSRIEEVRKEKSKKESGKEASEEKSESSSVTD